MAVGTEHGPEHGPEQEPEQYSFLEEVIKDEAFSWKRFAYRLAALLGRGFLFGLMACVAFVVCKPWVETTFRKTPSKVEIPKDDEQSETEVNQGEENAPLKPLKQTLTINHYRELAALMTFASLEAQKGVVEVCGVPNGAGNIISTGPIPITQKSAGAIIADNGHELLILTNRNVLNNAGILKVRFADATECNASLKRVDGNLGMAIVGVDRKDIQESTWARIKVLTLGNSNALNQGKTVIALGNPFGYSNGMGIGVIGSSQKTVHVADGEYQLLMTDMPRSDNASGILFNIDGEVIGIIAPTIYKETSVMVAYGISSIKAEIEMLSNAKDVPYIGIGTTVITEEISQRHNIPEGLCVMEVQPESPALAAGIQNGDVITHMDGKEMETINDYYNALLDKTVGSEVTLKGERRSVDGYVEITFKVIIGMKK